MPGARCPPAGAKCKTPNANVIHHAFPYAASLCLNFCLFALHNHTANTTNPAPTNARLQRRRPLLHDNIGWISSISFCCFPHDYSLRGEGEGGGQEQPPGQGYTIARQYCTVIAGWLLLSMSSLSVPVQNESLPNRQKEPTTDANAHPVGHDDGTNGVTHRDASESQSSTFTHPFTPTTAAQLNPPPPPSRRELVLSFLNTTATTDETTQIPANSDTEHTATEGAPLSLHLHQQTQQQHNPVLSNGGNHAVNSPARRGRGRPRGWRPGMSYSELHSRNPPTSDTQTPSQGRGRGTVKRGRVGRPPKLKDPNAIQEPPDGLAKRRGRPPKVPYPEPHHLFRTIRPSFVAFACEWQGCAAELHNLATLRRHLHIVHNPKARSKSKQPLDVKKHECRWVKCATAVNGALPMQFGSEEAWLAHLEVAHLIPCAWHIGEGPRNEGDCWKPKDVDQVPTFLLDKDGNQVTPWVRYQQEEDLVTYYNNRRKLKELLIQRDAKFASDSEDDDDDNNNNHNNNGSDAAINDTSKMT